MYKKQKNFLTISLLDLVITSASSENAISKGHYSRSNLITPMRAICGPASYL